MACEEEISKRLYAIEKKLDIIIMRLDTYKTPVESMEKHINLVESILFPFKKMSFLKRMR